MKPLPLKELIAQGHKQFWVYLKRRGGWVVCLLSKSGKFYVNGGDANFMVDYYGDRWAIPILKPERL